MFVSYRNFKEHCEHSDKKGIQNRSWKLCYIKKTTYVGFCFITRTQAVRTKAEVTHVIGRFKKGSEMFT